MSSTGNEYVSVAAFNTAGDLTYPSRGGTAVSGYWYYWTLEGGFSGSGWHLGLGPMKRFTTNEQVVNYINTTGQGTLNQIFRDWQVELNGMDEVDATLDTDNFYTAVKGIGNSGIINGCVSSVEIS